MTKDEILKKLNSLSDAEAVRGMARFGIQAENVLGISMPVLRSLAKEAGKDHTLALELWKTGIHEARILASLVDVPSKVTLEQMDNWVKDFDSWDVCDQCCLNLFDRTPFAYQKATEWSEHSEEFIKRAAFALMAVLSVHDKKASDEKLAQFFPIIERESTDARNFVKKAVNWALRQIGKRNAGLNYLAVETSKRILKQDSPVAKWIANDALRELTGDKISEMLKRRLK